MVSPRHAQEKTGPTWRSHTQAGQVLKAGIDAHGGIENIRRADKITLHYRAVNHPLGQNASIDAAPAEFQRAGSKFTLKPDALFLSPRPPVIETFERKRVFTDGKRTVELYSIGPTSHVADMVMFYFPQEKILFQGDMFSPLDAGGIPPIIDINHELVKKVEELRLDVETLIAVHSGAVAWKEFRRAVADAALR